MNVQDYVFFWGHNFRATGYKAYFSNWFPAPFEDDHGRRFSNSEQYMMWRKAVLFNDQVMADQIAKQGDPRKCKSLGRKVKGFEQQIWDANAMNIMCDGLRFKFSQNLKMNQALLATGDKTIVEASPLDAIWGIGMDEKAAVKALLSGNEFVGSNWLGLALMRVRSEMRQVSEYGEAHGDRVLEGDQVEVKGQRFEGNGDTNPEKENLPAFETLAK